MGLQHVAAMPTSLEDTTYRHTRTRAYPCSVSERSTAWAKLGWRVVDRAWRASQDKERAQRTMYSHYGILGLSLDFAFKPKSLL